jgi:hypothetical protein
MKKAVWFIFILLHAAGETKTVSVTSGVAPVGI